MRLKLVAVAALVVVVMLVWTSSASADESLGRLKFAVGQPGQQAYGVVTGTYGQLHSGRYPGALFSDGTARDVQSIVVVSVPADSNRPRPIPHAAPPVGRRDEGPISESLPILHSDPHISLTPFSQFVAGLRYNGMQNDTQPEK